MSTAIRRRSVSPSSTSSRSSSDDPSYEDDHEGGGAGSDDDDDRGSYSSDYEDEHDGGHTDGRHHHHHHHHHRGDPEDDDEYYDDDDDVDHGGDHEDNNPHEYEYEDEDHGNDKYPDDRRSQYAREDSMDVDDILLSNELFPITEMSLSSNATAAGGASGGGGGGSGSRGGGGGGGGSSGGIGMGGGGGGGSSSGGSAGTIPTGSIVSNMTSASTLNNSVATTTMMAPHPSPSAFQRTGSSRHSLGTYVGGPSSDPNDSYYADEDYGDGNGHHQPRHHGERDDDYDDDEGDTTLQGTVTEEEDDGDNDDDESHDNYDEDDPPSVSQYTERTYDASASIASASTAPISPRDPTSNPMGGDDDYEEGDEMDVEHSQSSRPTPARTASARSSSQRSGQSHSRRSRASTATATTSSSRTSAMSTSHNTTSSNTRTSSRSRSGSGSESRSSQESRSRSRSRSTSSRRSRSYSSRSSQSRRSGSRSMDEDYDDENDDGSSGSTNPDSQHSGGSHSRSHSHSRNTRGGGGGGDGSYSEGSYSREGEESQGSRHSDDDDRSASYRSGSYRSGSHGDNSVDDGHSPRSGTTNNQDDSYRSRSESNRSRSSRSYGSRSGPDESLRSEGSQRTSSSRRSRGADSYASGQRYEEEDGSFSRRSRGSASSSQRRSDRSGSNRESMSFDDDGDGEASYNDDYGQPPEESEHDAAIISQKRNRDHIHHPHQPVEQGYLSGESQVTPRRTNVADATPSDESDEGDDDDVAPRDHGITDEAIMEALQESGLAGIEGVVVEVGDDGVVRISSSSHHEDDDDDDDDDEVGSDHQEEGDDGQRATDQDRRAGAEELRMSLESAEHGSMQYAPQSDNPNGIAGEMYAVPPPSSPGRSRGGNASAPGSPIATTAMSGSVMSEAGWTSVTSDTNLSNEEEGNSSSDEDEMGPKLPRDPFEDSFAGRGSAHESESESNAEEEGSFVAEGLGLAEREEYVADSRDRESAHSRSSTGESDQDSKSYSRRSDSQSGSGYSGSQSLSRSSGTGPRTLDESQSDRSHSFPADEDNSRSETPSYTDSAGSASRQSEAFDSPSKDGVAVDLVPAVETPDSAHESAALSESQSFSELDDPTRLNKARARLLAAYASSGYDDASSPDQRSAKSFERTPSEATRGTRVTSDPAYDENIDALVIAVAAGAAAAAEAAPEEDEVFVDKVDVWSPTDDDKQAEFETSQRESSTSHNDPSYRSQASRQSYFEMENKDPLEEPSNSYRDGYDMDIEEPIYHGDTYYEEKLPRQAYGQPNPYQETVAYAGTYPLVDSEQANADSYYMYGEKHVEKLEAPPSELIPTLSLGNGDDDEEDDDVGTAAAHDLEAPGKKKIIIAEKSDEVDVPVSAFSKRDVRRMGFAIVVTALLMLCIFLPVLLTRRSGNAPAPAPAPTPAPQPFAPTPSPSLLPPSQQYVVTGGPFDGTIGTGFGASVGIGSEFAVIGAPLLSSASSFVYSSLQWGLGANLTGQSDSQFGSSISLVGDALLIGSPEALDASSTSKTGAAYFYEWDQVDAKWSMLGSALPGYSVALGAGDLFGAAVATSLNTRVAVGSPGVSSKIYVFQYAQTSSGSYDWLQMNNSPLVGVSSAGNFGSSVDISADGFRVVGGAPNDAAGSALVYSLSQDTSSWELEFQAAGATDGEGFGTSVRFLSTTGDYLAVGGPGGNSGGGVIRIYSSSSGPYQQLGHDITGDEGQALGSTGSLAGNQSANGLFVLAGTELGSVRRFDFASSTGMWTEKFAAVTAEASRVTGLSTSGADTFIVGQADVAKSTIFSVDTIPNETPSSVPVPPFPSLNPVTVAPVLSPSSLSPTITTPGFVLVGGPFVGNSGSTLGKSVAMSASIMAAGDTSGAGTVQTYVYNAETWQEMAVIQGSETGSLFGFSVDVTATNASLAVGAPSTLKNGTSTAVGSAYFYSFDAVSNSWVQVGSQIRGEEDIFAANEAFGASVAASETGQIVVVGAPFSSELNIVRVGRVYPFEFNAGIGEWTPRQATSLTGDQAETNLGTSIDLSVDGSILVAGGPGHNSDTGYVVVYAWDGYRYTIVSTFEGESSGERFGSSVRILSDDGDATYVAAGAPAYSSDQGAIRIFQRQSNGTYSLMASPIVGFAGDGLGSRGSLASGGVDATSNVPVVVAATSTGMLRRFAFNLQTASWDDGTNLSTGMSGSPAVASSPGGNSVVVGGNNQAAIYGISP